MIIEMYEDMFWISQTIQALKRLTYIAEKQHPSLEKWKL